MGFWLSITRGSFAWPLDSPDFPSGYFSNQEKLFLPPNFCLARQGNLPASCGLSPLMRSAPQTPNIFNFQLECRSSPISGKGSLWFQQNVFFKRSWLTGYRFTCWTWLKGIFWVKEFFWTMDGFRKSFRQWWLQDHHWQFFEWIGIALVKGASKDNQWCVHIEDILSLVLKIDRQLPAQETFYSQLDDFPEKLIQADWHSVARPLQFPLVHRNQYWWIT